MAAALPMSESRERNNCAAANLLALSKRFGILQGRRAEISARKRGFPLELFGQSRGELPARIRTIAKAHRELPFHSISFGCGVSRLGSGTSVNVASVKSNTPATDTAFSSAIRTTLVGSMMPASTRST